MLELDRDSIRVLCCSVALLGLSATQGCSDSKGLAGNRAPASSLEPPAGPLGSAGSATSADPSAGAAYAGPGGVLWLRASAGAGGSGAAMAPGADTASTDGDGAADADAGIEEPDPIEILPGQLTAGEWCDLDHWDFWRDLALPDEQCGVNQDCPGIGGSMSSYWGFETNGRIPVHVQHGEDDVVDAVVTLRDADDAVLWSARTDNKGRAELFAGVFESVQGDLHVVAEAEGESVQAAVDEAVRGGDTAIEVELPVAHAPPPSLDLMFVIDTTGSMGDELSYLQAELGHVIERVRDEIGVQLHVRLSVNFYRDRGDDYVVRDFPFTEELDTALAELGDQVADGGGDLPEAMEEALKNGVGDHAWSDDATARLMFLVLDAPPHYDAQRLESLQQSTRLAAEKGVQIIPLAASGVDKETEFLLRLLSMTTNGSYTFLTDDSGIGNSHIEPTIGFYKVELLDDLMVRAIRERL